MSSTLRIRGGGPPVAATPSDVAAPQPAKKIRIEAFDSLRFFLIACIVGGHFISFAKPTDFIFKFVSQHNVAVGGFFALSGYVTAYTTTEQGKREASKSLITTPKPKWILSRIFGYYPLHLIVLALFSPMFLYTDVHYSGWPTALWHGFLSVSLLQSWFPLHAEVWNAPTWYLSALNFITVLMPFALQPMAKMNKKQLRKTAFYLGLISLLPKIGYLYDFNAWSIVEGVTSPKTHPNIAIFNLLRFSPLFQAAEVMLGAVACRLVMLDSDPEEKELKPKTNALSTALPLLGIVGFSYLRATDVVQVSEFIARSIFFVPVFLRFLMSIHRNTVSGVSDPTCSILSNKMLVWLGNLAFPIFVVHGPIGQVFFKKFIATQVFGKVMTGPANFGLYLATTVASAWVLQKTVLQNKAIGAWSKDTVGKLSEAM
jgi:peptidoglycan/LPS O-acetylase OafA/YrhL